jgi:hypothetical protein
VIRDFWGYGVQMDEGDSPAGCVVKNRLAAEWIENALSGGYWVPHRDGVCRMGTSMVKSTSEPELSNLFTSRPSSSKHDHKENPTRFHSHLLTVGG